MWYAESETCVFSTQSSPFAFFCISNVFFIVISALVGTLRAAKRKKIVSYDGELLLQGVHDNVEIILLAS